MTDRRDIRREALLDAAKAISDYPDLQEELEMVRADAARLAWAVVDLTGCGDEACAMVHHVRADRHSVAEPCPVLTRYRQFAEGYIGAEAGA